LEEIEDVIVNRERQKKNNAKKFLNELALTRTRALGDTLLEASKV